MLRSYFLQQWFNLSDPGVEDALCDSLVMRRFVGVDLGRESAPDETTVCKFRHLLERHELGKRIFALVNSYVTQCRIQIAPAPSKIALVRRHPACIILDQNKKEKRDPEMHQVRKGRQWYFSRKANVGVGWRRLRYEALS